MNITTRTTMKRTYNYQKVNSIFELACFCLFTNFIRLICIRKHSS